MNIGIAVMHAPRGKGAVWGGRWMGRSIAPGLCLCKLPVVNWNMNRGLFTLILNNVFPLCPVGLDLCSMARAPAIQMVINQLRFFFWGMPRHLITVTRENEDVGDGSWCHSEKQEHASCCCKIQRAKYEDIGYRTFGDWIFSMVSSICLERRIRRKY